MQQLDGKDARFLYGEIERAPMHIGSLLIYDQSTAPGGKVRFRDILRVFDERTDRTTVFTRRLLQVPFDIDHPFWVEDEHFDLESHVNHIALPRPGTWRQFCTQVARLHARPLDRSRPLWEAFVIEGLDRVEGLPRGCFALLLKVHHAAVDGASAVEMFTALHDVEPRLPRPAAPLLRRTRRVEPPGELEVLAHITQGVIRQRFGLMRLMGRALPALRRMDAARQDQYIASLAQKERTRFNGRISAHRVFGGALFALKDMSAIKRQAPGATVNDVMLTLVGGAMRRYLDAKGELPRRSLIAGVPVNIRTRAERRTGGNLVSMMSMSLCSDIVDPAEQLHAVHAGAVRSKAYLNAVGARQLTDWSNDLPAQLAVLGFRAAAATGLMSSGRPRFNTIVTNVPGPRSPLYLAGARLVRSFGAGPCSDGMGLFQVVTSYAGQIAIAFQACREMLPDPAFYERCLRESFAALQAALPAGGRPSAATPPARTETARARAGNTRKRKTAAARSGSGGRPRRKRRSAGDDAA